ncbi:hypothetical protein A2801_02115 [Candidatus Woesebacteria bacterium RIFCSPHIGHO2_01_FULL_41_10]|uniref:Uncharacterized protein n=1 Tax=Candidatus Woesebacteria bacterium RIFCSPHIGHO2_01_FULL_41_10 TaxID=1802500 RepID=A0A1F7YQZ2_9BACT|nr:MAG: hypothetical protein A2801_02115 [Candidatus Woesebacteria bacterium RIFCSPHIGHO2_01_FULL_41_10]
MSEIPESQIAGLAENLRQFRGKAVAKEELQRIVESSSNFDYVNNGTECVVVSEPGRDNTVVAIDYAEYETVQAAKEIFYTQRVLSTLFPDNFPHFYTSYGREPLLAKASGKAKFSGTVRERVIPAEPGTNAQHPFAKAKAEIRRLSLPVSFDSSPGNYMLGENGGQYYVDKPQIQPGSWNREQIIGYMEDRGYSDTDKRIVDLSIQRIGELRINAYGAR